MNNLILFQHVLLHLFLAKTSYENQQRQVRESIYLIRYEMKLLLYQQKWEMLVISMVYLQSECMKMVLSSCRPSFKRVIIWNFRRNAKRIAWVPLRDELSNELINFILLYLHVLDSNNNVSMSLTQNFESDRLESSLQTVQSQNQSNSLFA